jgi:regulation of enolase protein 1 (concanavalin A-like superfamily)
MKSKIKNVMRMNRFLYIRLVTIILLSLGLSYGLMGQDVQNKDRDGKLLRGEKWQRFVPTKKADFYVAENGNDNWSGTLAEPNSGKTDGPFATLKRAQQAVRGLKAKVYFPKEKPVETRYIGSPHKYGKGRDILVAVRAGHYSLDEPLVFSPEDGGERVETNLPSGAFEYHKLKDYYVTYTAYPGEKPVVAGGTMVSNWQKKGNVWVAPFSADTASMLVVNGKRQILARTPNQGYFVPPVISPATKEICFRKGEIKNWKQMENNRVVMLLRWHTGINRIVAVDEKTGIATFQSPQDGVVIVPPRYYIENVKDLLDAPGEWYFDKKQKQISYIPADGIENPNQVISSVPHLSNLISIEGELGKPVRNLRFYGITLEGATAGNSAVNIEYAHACEFFGGGIRSCSGTGISVKKGCYETRILNNHFETIDNGVIYCNGPQNPKDGRDIIRETTISYNKIYDCGGNNIYAAYTLLTTISHNYITKTRGRYAIDVGGWSNQEEAIDGGYLVEYNHLDDVQRDADDSGAIKTAGITFNSVVRRNLIHNVHAGFFNDNVGFWFDNMSLGWTSEENIFYSLEQGEMKYCAALPEDNIYRNNFKIKTPIHAPEMIIDGDPKFTEKNLNVEAASKTPSGAVVAGSVISVSADVFNSGSSGMAPVKFYVDGKVYSKKLFPVIKNNVRKIDFEIRMYDAGEHSFAIGSTPYQTIYVEGNKPEVVFEDFQLQNNRVLNGEVVKGQAVARNLSNVSQNLNAGIFLDDKKVTNVPVELPAGESVPVTFEIKVPTGNHQIRLENSAEKSLQVFDAVPLDMAKMDVLQYCSAKAKPFEIEANPEENWFKITASGSDFFHAEDSYAAAYVKEIKGDFVATVKINQFGNRTNEWFRAGLFVRNDISKSFDVQPGSKGSVLVFATPGRAGIEYDEFANGCMHKANSENLPENSETPIYLKLVRHGNSFSGYISLDGKNWIIERHTTNIPSINDKVDLGLAAGSPDKKQYWVEFTDWKIEVQK